ncbi:MAG: hypothetical protein KGI00_05185 [Candidatus Micrarchaeota archaeon]|nr:hypothetical protein [Candidatus Micrarchaeota archaeon]MDE1850092.1 hypothetical protein [Candidatus Micrarchaeota archaeon]
MADKDEKRKPNPLIRYLVALVIAVIIIAAYLLSQHNPPAATTTTKTASTTITYLTTAYVNNTSTIPPTTIVQQLSDNVYCIGGYNGINGNETDLAFHALLSQNGTSAWLPTTSYPIGIARSSCLQYNSTIYCIGGQQQFGGQTIFTNSTYYLSLPTTSISSWLYAIPYPQPVYSTSCVTSGNMAYCIGGINASNASTLDYYATLNSNGTLGWRNTTAYPSDIYAQSCAASSGYVYCVGGWLKNNVNATPSTYYAALNSSGIGAWKQSTPYPISVIKPACVISDGYIYCVGNSLVVGEGNTSYYAPISSSGIGGWIHTSNYPQNIGGTYGCVSKSGLIYCTGGGGEFGPETNATYYAQLSPSGIGKWRSTSPYPLPIALQSCITT